MLVDELQAGLADGDIYLSVYLKEVWFKIFSLDLFIYLCVCVCFKPYGFNCLIHAERDQPQSCSLLSACQSA